MHRSPRERAVATSWGKRGELAMEEIGQGAVEIRPGAPSRFP